MSEDEALEGALVPAPPPEDIRYEDEDAQKVTRVLVVVERADGTVKEYEAREPERFMMSDPEDISTMAFRVTGLALGAGGAARGVQAAVPTLSLSFAANPRYNLHIRNVRRAGEKALGS
jgi:hypothetical protein